MSVLTTYHLLSPDYVCVRHFHFRIFSLCLYAEFDSFLVWSDIDHISKNINQRPGLNNFLVPVEEFNGFAVDIFVTFPERFCCFIIMWGQFCRILGT